MRTTCCRRRGRPREGKLLELGGKREVRLRILKGNREKGFLLLPLPAPMCWKEWRAPRDHPPSLPTWRRDSCLRNRQKLLPKQPRWPPA